MLRDTNANEKFRKGWAFGNPGECKRSNRVGAPGYDRSESVSGLDSGRSRQATWVESEVL